MFVFTFHFLNIFDLNGGLFLFQYFTCNLNFKVLW